MPNSRIIFHDVKFTLFDTLNLTFLRQKTGLIGRNGSGKTTLLRLISRKCTPEKGSITVDGSLYYLPQIPLLSPTHNLSGGEYTRKLITEAFASHADFLLLDEPTNHLDQASKQNLFEQIKHWRNGLIIASHDRALLQHMDHIIEINNGHIKHYGGNYAHYSEQKKLEITAQQRQLDDAKKHLHKTQHSIQSSYEKHSQKQSYGKKLRKTKRIDKMAADAKKGRSEKTQAKMLIKHQRMLDSAQTHLRAAREQINHHESLNIVLPKTTVPQGKMIVDIQHLNFRYPHNNQLLLFNQFNLTVYGPQRIAVIGNNGSGKSTLLKLILGHLKPSSGTITLGTQNMAYLDQHASQLDPAISIVDNFLMFNPDASLQQAHLALAQFLFRNTAAHKIVGELSGGEKLRALLACLLMSSCPPQLLLLDEPTNHLDMHATLQIESALKLYQGTMIVVSHDRDFLEALECTHDAIYL